MSIRVPRKSTNNPNQQFRGSLVRNVVLWLLVLSALPVVIIGTVTYFRTRSLLRDQVNRQMQVIVDNYGQDLNQLAVNHFALINTMAEDAVFSQEFGNALADQLSPGDKEILRGRLNEQLSTHKDATADSSLMELFILDGQGNVILSTHAQREGKNYSDTAEIWSLQGKSAFASIYNRPGLFSQSMVWLTTQVYRLPATQGVYTLYGVSTSTLPQTVLTQAKKYFPTANASLFTSDNLILSLSSSGNILGYQNPGQEMNALDTVRLGTNSDFIRYQDQQDRWILGYARWLPDVNTGLVVEIPESEVFQQLSQMIPFFVLITLFGLLITGISVAFGSSRLVTPLLVLVEHVRSFSQGDWTHRAQVNRQDEIGLLANSFNLMADQISSLYRSLETKIDERNRQIRTASEVAQVSTSTTSRAEILKRTVALVTDRFQYDYACIYLLDASGDYFSLQEVGGRLGQQEAEKRSDGRILRQSLFGRVISSRKSVVFNSRPEDENDSSESLLADSQAQIVVPVISGDEILGLLDIQNANANAFDDDTVSVLEMLAYQVANGIQNIRLLESTRVDLQETSLLYQASREITRAGTHPEIMQILSHAVEQTPHTAMLLDVTGDQVQAVRIIDRNHETKTIPNIVITFSRISGQIANRSHLIFDHLNLQSEFYPILSFFMQRGCSQSALLPIRKSGNLSQLLVLGAQQEHTFSATSLQPYLNLVEVISNAEERFTVLGSLEENLLELKTLANVSQAISVETDLNELFRLLHAQIRQAIGGDPGFYIGLYNRKTNLIEMPYIVEHGEQIHVDPFPLGEGLTSILIKRGEPLLLSQNAVKQAAALGARIIGAPSKSWLGVPLAIAGEVIGVMVAEDTEIEGRFTEKELHLFTVLAPQVAVAIRNAQLLAEMQTALAAYDQERYLLNTLLENIPDQVYFKDRAGSYIRASRSHTDSITEQQKLEETPPTGQQSGNVDLQIMEAGEPQIGSVEKRSHADGLDEWALTSRMPMYDAFGNVTGLLGISRDISDLKQAEELAQKRAGQIRTAAEIARDTSGMLNLDELLVKSVNLVRDRFGYYHASIFLFDAVGEYAVLRESTGEAGRQLKEVGHRLAVGSQSLVGQATQTGSHMVVNDVTLDPHYYPNPHLPMTRSELVIPLQVGERVHGALDVQSTAANAFREEDVSILQILADQLAVAIVNAGLFVETQENITKHRFLHQITSAAAGCTNLEDALSTTVQSLATALGTERVAAYLIDKDSSLALRATYGYEQIEPEMTRIAPGEGVIGLASLGGHPILVRDTQTDTRCTHIDRQMRSQLAVPILYSDQVVGVLNVASQQVAAFNESDQEILGSLGNTLGAILSNARLVNQIRLQMEQQKNLFEVTSKIRRSNDIQAILETSTREICNALGARRAHMEVTISAPAEETVSANSGSNGYHNSMPQEQQR